MRNITGSPAEGGDFFDRPADLERLDRELRNLANLLFVAPRRVGKTSLILRFCSRFRTTTTAAVFINVEEQLARLLGILQRDGYLVEGGGRYAFRSFLLREFWFRRHAR